MALLNFSQNSIRSEPQFDRFGEAGFAKAYIKDRYSRNTLPIPHFCGLGNSETLGELGKRRKGRKPVRAVKRVGRLAVRAIPAAAAVKTGGVTPVAARAVRRPVAARILPAVARPRPVAAAVRPRPVTRPVAARAVRRPVAARILPAVASVLPAAASVTSVAARTRPEFDPGVIPRRDDFPDYVPSEAARIRHDVLPDYAPSRIPERDAEMRQPSFDPTTGELIAEPVKRDREFPWKWILLGLGGFLLITSLSEEKEKRIRGK
ncbi:MAG: hypothetical protein DDT22_00256 [candidate division WS2 bacterium]|nr:hypothetical protein [Candidatus Lithacetigena glycinireducens]